MYVCLDIRSFFTVHIGSHSKHLTYLQLIYLYSQPATTIVNQPYSFILCTQFQSTTTHHLIYQPILHHKSQISFLTWSTDLNSIHNSFFSCYVDSPLLTTYLCVFFFRYLNRFIYISKWIGCTSLNKQPFFSAIRVQLFLISCSRKVYLSFSWIRKSHTHTHITCHNRFSHPLIPFIRSSSKFATLCVCCFSPCYFVHICSLLHPTANCSRQPKYYFK